MSLESTKLLAQRVWEEVWHQGQLSRIDDLFTTDFVRHDPGGRELQGTEQNRQFIGSLRAAFPDVHYTVEDQIAEGDKVVVRYRFRGTHLGAFQGMPPTGKQVTYTGILIYSIVDGKIAEQWTEFDLLGFLRQLGVLPTS
ncbi:MAG TPA: ester cyclase [Ktedonobacteraceae bacterium]